MPTNLEPYKKYNTEKALVAVGLGGLYIFLAYEGEQLEFDIGDVSPSPNDVIGDGAFPSAVGIYFWTGRASLVSYETFDSGHEPEMVWVDELIRPATAQDFVDFGLEHLVRQLILT